MLAVIQHQQGPPARAKTDAGLSEAGGAFYDAALDRSCKLYVRAVEQVPAFVGRSSAEILSRLSDLSDQVARVIDAQREAQAVVAGPDGGVTVAGWPLEEVTDPFVLEVHWPVQPEDAPPGLPVLPSYVPREHDQVLGQVVRAAAEGRSGIAVLVGGSSTGKTRACWEALTLLRDQDPPWRLWHPIDPSRPDAALRDLPGIGPRTVVWLNEAQDYLNVADGERVAAGLRELLRAPGRAPVLVLATVWPKFWDTLTARPEGGEDRHAQARELLAGHDITVPGAFTPAQMTQLAQSADVRLVLAARSAPDGAVIQFLAGVPELLARYRNARPAARALIDAAMDARRLGSGTDLPQAFLEAAAPWYLTDAEWYALGKDWLERALKYTDRNAKGVRGPLTLIRPRPAGRPARSRGDPPASTAAAAGPLYRLADYLDQYGRAHRASQIPPAEFWSAAAAHAAPGDQAALGDAAHARGLLRAAAELDKYGGHRDARACVRLVRVLRQCWPADYRPAQWAAGHVPLDDPVGVASLLDWLRAAGAQDQVTVLLARDPAAHAAVDDPRAVTYLLRWLRGAEAQAQVTVLAARAAGHVAVDDLYGVGNLLGELRVAGMDEQVTLLAARAAGHATLDDAGDVAWLLGWLRGAEAQDQVTALLARDPAAHAALDDPAGIESLLDALRKADAQDQVTALATRVAGHAAVAADAGDDPYRFVGWLLGALREASAHAQVTALAARAVGHAAVDDPRAVTHLLRWLRGAEAQDQVTALLARDPAAHAALDDPGGVAFLLDWLRAAGVQDQVTALLARDPAAHAALDDPIRVSVLLDTLRKADAQDQVTALLARDPAGHAALEGGVHALARSLRAAGAHAQATALAARAAGQAPLDDPYHVAYLLDWLRGAEAQDQVTALLARDPAAHAALDNLGGVASLLDALRKADAQAQVTALAARAAGQAPLDDNNPYAVRFLLDSLQKAGAHEQAAALASRLPAAGMFGLFTEQDGLADQFRFGREADGTPAAPWDLEDLG